MVCSVAMQISVKFIKECSVQCNVQCCVLCVLYSAVYSVGSVSVG